MARPNQTLDLIAEFLTEKALQAASTLEQVEKIRKEQGENAVQLIVSHPNYRKALQVTYSVAELHEELRISKPTLHRILTPSNGAVLAEYGITMRMVGSVQKWTYDGALLTNDAKISRVGAVVGNYKIPDYPTEGSKVRQEAIAPLVPRYNARGEKIVGTYHLSEVEVGALRAFHDRTIFDGKSNPRAAMLLSFGLLQGSFDIVAVEGKENMIAGLKSDVVEYIPNPTHYEVDATDMYPLPDDPQ